MAKLNVLSSIIKAFRQGVKVRGESPGRKILTGFIVGYCWEQSSVIFTNGDGRKEN